MTLLLLLLAPLVVFLFVLIFRMNHAEHFAPQAYYRKKRGGAPVAFGFESLGPRPRKPPPSDDEEVPQASGAEEPPPPGPGPASARAIPR